MTWNGIEINRSDFGTDLRDWVAFSLALMANTHCSNRKAALELLYHEADSIIAQVQSGKAP